jgi:hypothetical protein
VALGFHWRHLSAPALPPIAVAVGSAAVPAERTREHPTESAALFASSETCQAALPKEHFYSSHSVTSLPSAHSAL